LNTQHLRVFEAVARSGSIGGAADILKCTQPTVSHHLAAFEKQLGTMLFVRGRRGVELTDRGKVLLEHAHLILAQLDAAERAVQDIAELRVGALRIGAFGTAGTTFLPRYLAAFRAEHPTVRLLVHEVDSPADALEAVRTRRLDVAFAYVEPGHWVRPMPGVLVEQLMVDPLLVVLPPGHPLARRETVNLAQLAAERWIANRSDQDPCSTIFRHACEAAGFEPEIALRIDSFTMVGECVRVGLGVALAPRLAVPLLGDEVHVVGLDDPSVARVVCALTLADASSAARLAFMRLLHREDLAGSGPAIRRARAHRTPRAVG
jgi:DNA-binding transcriptional LysR family regulator